MSGCDAEQTPREETKFDESRRQGVSAWDAAAFAALFRFQGCFGCRNETSVHIFSCIIRVLGNS